MFRFSPSEVVTAALLFGATSFASAPPAQANLLINGSFEQGPVGNPAGDSNNNLFANLPSGVGVNQTWDTWTTLPGWTATRMAGSRATK